MTTSAADDDLAAAAIDYPATDRQGQPGKDAATEHGNAIRLLRMRTAGMSYAQIAAEAGYAHKSGARQAIMRALERVEAENVAELRALENARLDEDELALRAIIRGAQTSPGMRIRAVDARVRLSARRSRMNGLDAPTKVDLSSGVRRELNDALSELEQLIMAETDDEGVPQITELADDDAAAE